MEMSPRQAAIRAIERLPDDASWDDIIYAVHVCLKIDRGQRDVENGNTLSHEEAMREINEWLRSAGH